MNRFKGFARAAVLLVVCVAVTLPLFSAEAFAANPSPLVELTLGPGTKVYGLTAMDSLGKKTGTLKEFAESVVTGNVKSYTVFPANFFNAYDDTKEIVGGIYSQGAVVHNSWFDYGCGFDVSNNFHMFKLPSYVTNEKDGKIIAKNAYGYDAEVITAFDCYPWLVQNNTALEIAPFPGADEPYLNGKVRRAFMGQKADGTFVYGILSGSDMWDTQRACVDLGLVNAVNVDGGASCGVYQNGEYLAAPGRELASVVCIIEEDTPVVMPGVTVPETGMAGTPVPGAVGVPETGTVGVPETDAAAANPLAAAVTVNGRQVLFDAYNINGSSFFKLRDLAFALNGTSAQFDITAADGIINIIISSPYTPVGGEMAAGDGAAKQAVLTRNPIQLNGFPLALTAYSINGSDYFKLADIAAVLGFTADFADGVIVISTK